jgi:hypothetical protein
MYFPMEATCIVSGKPFVISEKEIAYCRDHAIPLPRLHPHERLKRVLSFRNRTFLYNAICAASQKPILSCIPPDSGLSVYDNDIWNSEQWDPLSYGQDYDPSRPFLDQLKELYRKVPLPNLTLVRSSVENSEYVNGAVNLKNCYLTFASTHLEDCMFCWNVFECKNVLNCISSQKCELCYYCRNVTNCYRLQYADNCSSCSSSYFLESCSSCKDCYGCVNLSNKQYCWYNEQLTKEAYEQKLATVNLGSYQVRQAEVAKFEAFKKTMPIKYQQGQNNEDVTGNFMSNSKNCTNVFNSTNAVDVENCVATNKSKDSFCSAYFTGGELVYAAHAGVENYNIQFCAECIHSRDMMYCVYCVQGCTDCLGCVGLKKKQYCILNKQYTKEEYERLAALIRSDLTTKNQWDEYFPRDMSPFYYNQSDAMIVFPMTKDQALKQGYRWYDDPVRNEGESYVLPDQIADVTGDILQATLNCEETQKPYRVIKAELAFYREHNIPVPRIAPLTQVHNQAAVFRVDDLRDIVCSQCHRPLQSVYDPTERPVLCQECYTSTVY